MHLIAIAVDLQMMCDSLTGSTVNKDDRGNGNVSTRDNQDQVYGRSDGVRTATGLCGTGYRKRGAGEATLAYVPTLLVRLPCVGPLRSSSSKYMDLTNRTNYRKLATIRTRSITDATV